MEKAILNRVLLVVMAGVYGCSGGPVTSETPLNADAGARCASGDGQCPPECRASGDADCTTCGDGTVGAGETCDTGLSSGAGSCPTSCAKPADACTASVLTNAGTCSAVCVATPVTTCVDGDGCCPAGCTGGTDSDCAGCGDGVVAGLEACDTAIASGAGACPSSCPGSSDACAPLTLLNPATCAAVCVPAPITACATGDGCCPAGCSGANDADCAGCGDGQVSETETCDTAIASGAGACPTSCPPGGDVCSPSVLRNAGTCSATCVAEPVTACVNLDGCCPAGCTFAGGDTDCPNVPVDTSGTWVVKLVAPGHIKTVSTLGITMVDADVTITSWIRDFVSADGTIEHRMCKMTTEGPTMRNTYSQAMFDTLVVTAKRDVMLPIGGEVPVPQFVIRSGQDATQPTPKSIDAPPVGDGDGKPGVTVQSWTQTFNTTIDTYLGLVITSTTSDVTLVDANTMKGMTSFSAKGYVFDSSKSLLVGPGSTVDQTTKDARLPFTAERLDTDGSHDCAYVTSHY